ncbi:MAG: mechanosensitive ion channel family protein [Candidatus Aenigmarchaeota archaeon]|nr:mechanosensitive ion channel family protein [Candidatus Aenigmarchaeota archaeon]
MFENLIPQDYLYAILILIGSVICAKIFYFTLKQYVAKITAKTKTTMDDELVEACHKPIYMGIMLIGGYYAVNYLKVLIPYKASIETFFVVAGVALSTWTLVKIIDTFVMHYTTKDKTSRAQKTVFLSLKGLINIFIYVIAIFIILSYFNVEITPLLASLGVAGLAVALALQSTLANYFAGLYISSDRSIKISDYIELENGLKGHVEKIGWRSTQIRTLPNNLVIIPNAKLSEMIVTNYSDPTEELSFSVNCGVGYDSDLEKVEKITISVAKKMLKSVDGGVETYEPLMRFKNFGDSNIEFSIILRVKEFVSQYKMRHEFIKALTKEFRKNKIEIAFPCLNIYNRK